MLTVAIHGTSAFQTMLQDLRRRGDTDFAKVEVSVRAILDHVRTHGDAAVTRYVGEFEKRQVSKLFLRAGEDYDGAAALSRLPQPARDALAYAAARIERFHERERSTMFPGDGFRLDDAGSSVGLRVRPLARVGVYAPGGKARYPSSVLMSAIPARVAGVPEIVLASPLAGAEAGQQDPSNDMIFAAAHLAGVTAMVDAGGAQAIGALAYGTPTIPQVDKIVGPGNAYVACAKRLVYGTVAIDSIAGPSEILVLADATARAAVVAADLLSQAEHDEDAYVVLASSSRELIEEVQTELVMQLSSLPRKAIASEALRRHGQAFLVPGRADLAALADSMAAEHLSLQVEDPDALLATIHHAGAVFMGTLTPEAAGDYVAGPSHVLPTGGAVRFGSPLGVHDFMTRTSVIHYSAEGLRRDADAICALARLEGLEAHARAVTVRTLPPPPSGQPRAGADGPAPPTKSRT